MKPSTLFPVGLVCLLVGGLWTLQGFGAVGGSGMSDVRFWGFAGIALCLVGLGFVTLGVRKRR